MFQQEFVYIIDDKTDKKREDGSCICYRDKEKFNRFVFEWPPEWRTSSVKERVIGFRSLWISKEYREVYFIIFITEEDDTIHDIHVDSWISEEHDLRKLWYDIKRDIQKYIDKMIGSETPAPFKVDDFEMGFDYDNGTFNNYLRLNKDRLKIKLSPINDDAKAVFNTNDDITGDEETPNLLRFENIWNRKDCCLKSSFSISNGNNYLGYSNKSYDPIKYYKINCNEPYFYIDLFHSNNHDIPVNLPVDNKDSIVLGIVIPDQGQK